MLPRIFDIFTQVDRSLERSQGGLGIGLTLVKRLTEMHGGDVTVLTVGRKGAMEALRKALAMGAARAVHVADDALRGSDARATVEVLAATLRKVEFDLAFVGADTSDGARRRRRRRGRRATRTSLPFICIGDRAERRRRPHPSHHGDGL